MPIDKSQLAAARTTTAAAASAARDADVISDALHAQLTDGAVSVQDWAAALSVRNQNYGSLIDAHVDGPADGTSAGELAHKLFVAVNDQREAQGMARTVLHTVKDLLAK